MKHFQSKFVNVNGINTHYLEAGSGQPLVLLHGGEFGGCAELSWEYNIEQLSKHFHVYAPDWLGYGKTDKIFDFTNMIERRINHISDFLNVLNIADAHFIGNSMGGTLLAKEAAKDNPKWKMKKIVIVSGGGVIPENEARETLNSYNCTREHMQEILKVLFHNDDIITDEYVNKRFELSLEPGAWECTAASRFKSPSTKSKSEFKTLSNISYENVKTPTLIMVGAKDKLRNKNYYKELVDKIPNNKLYIFENSGHCPNIENSEEFNKEVINFLTD